MLLGAALALPALLATPLRRGAPFISPLLRARTLAMLSSGHHTGVSLLLATETDAASMVQLEALLARGHWRLAEPPAGSDSVSAWTRADARLWCINKPFLHADDLDERWAAAASETVAECVFLSRHASASGAPCLTVHPIGLPSPTTTAEDAARYGGRIGVAVPPGRRLASLYRRLYQLKKESAGSVSVPEGFGVSLEATHHGPYLRAPSLFIEIGSTEAEWARTDAAEVTLTLTLTQPEPCFLCSDHSYAPTAPFDAPEVQLRES